MKRRLSVLLSIMLLGASTAVPQSTVAQSTNPLCTYQTDPVTGALVLDANGNPILTTCTTNFVVGALDTNANAPTFEIASQDGVVDPSPN